MFKRHKIQLYCIKYYLQTMIDDYAWWFFLPKLIFLHFSQYVTNYCEISKYYKNNFVFIRQLIQLFINKINY